MEDAQDADFVTKDSIDEDVTRPPYPFRDRRSPSGMPRMVEAQTF